MALDTAQFTVVNMTGRLSDGQNFSVASANGSFVLLQDATYDLDLSMVELTPGQSMKLKIDPNGRLPDRLDSLKIASTQTFSKPWDRSAIERARPQPTTITLELAQALWGQLELRLAGDVTVEGSGSPNGQVTVKAVNWEEILDLAVDSGAIPTGSVRTVEGLLKTLARASGPPNTIDVPLTLKNGMITFGFLPLGPAPNLRLP